MLYNCSILLYHRLGVITVEFDKQILRQFILNTVKMFAEEFGTLFSHMKTRLFIVVSMVAQMLLIVWTYKREKSSSQPIKRTLWLVAFLVADFAATVSLGNIFNFEIQSERCIDNPKNKFLMAFWAPFILKHLGRHGKVTAFSLEDNEFWPRHVIAFLLNVLTVIFIIIKAFNNSPLLNPLVLLIITGTLKFGERVFALKHGSMNEQRTISTLKTKYSGLDVHDLAERIDVSNRSGHHCGDYRLDLDNIPTINTVYSTPFSADDHVKSLCEAYQNFNKYKGIFTDSSPTCYKLISNHRCRFLEDMTNEQCLDSIRMDVKFAYELFYTKSVVSHTVWGWIIQVLGLISLIYACAFYSRVEKDGFSKPDVLITYALVITALILETMSFVEAVTSTRSLVRVAILEGKLFRMLEKWILKLRYLPKYITRKINHVPRRSRKIGQYSLLGACFQSRKSWNWVKAVLKYLHITEIWQNYTYSEFVPFEEQLINDIIELLKQKLIEKYGQKPNAGNAKLGLTDWVSLPTENSEIQRKSLEKVFTECVLIWHIATDICWMTRNRNSQGLENAHILSNYMLYLMVVQPAAMSSIAIAELSAYHDACEEGNRFFAHRSIGNNEKANAYRTMKRKYYKIFKNSVRDPKSLLQDGYELAEELEAFWEENMLEFGSKLLQLWVEFLSFAAISCRGKEHAQLLGTGWQPLTFVWLFMAHCGMPSLNRIANAGTVTVNTTRSEPE